MKNMNEETLTNEQNERVKKKEINNRAMTLKDWMITLLITFIPLVNLIMLFVWAFSEGENVNKANWAKANLLWMAIAVVLALIFFGLIMGFASSGMQS